LRVLSGGVGDELVIGAGFGQHLTESYGGSDKLSEKSVPRYEPMLDAYHRAFAGELRAMVASLPITAGQTVLDMACGDGVYGPWLAERVGPGGRVAGVDVVSEYLAIARKKAAESPLAAIIDFSLARIDALPFDDDTFDFCWCAQSLYSLPHPVDAVRHMLRVTKPGGTVALLEGDTLHHMILPWPIEVELAMRAAELQFLAKKPGDPQKFYVGRDLRRVCREAGLERIESRTFATDRAAPLGPSERTFFTLYLKDLSRRIASHLDGPFRGELDRLVDPGSGEFLLDDPDLTATCIDHVVWGSKPTTRRQRGV
jgi:ubiquinone/menaquinone biosynthesis C-methylase UbiE